MITIQMIIQNNESTIHQTLESIEELNAKLLFADIGCKDKTSSICKKYGEVIKMDFRNNRSDIRNKLVEISETEWNLQLEPWEIIIRGKEDLNNLQGNSLYRCNLIQNTLITKPIRIWPGKQAKFSNPVFESIVGTALPTSIYIKSTEPDTSDNKLFLLDEWKKRNPVALEPYYYSACILLTQNKWKEFIDVGNYFLFQEKKITMASIMTRYYMATVYCYVFKEYYKALELLLYCLSNRPLMAEFWCLLGDIYYETNEYDKAECFYENAKVLGSRRLNSDEWPFDITKYKDYPNKMMESCKQLVAKTNKFSTKLQAR